MRLHFTGTFSCRTLRCEDPSAACVWGMRHDNLRKPGGAIDPRAGSGPDPHLPGHPPGPVGREAVEGGWRAVAPDPGSPAPHFRLRTCDPDPRRSSRPCPGHPFTSAVASDVRPPPPRRRGVRHRISLRISPVVNFSPCLADKMRQGRQDRGAPGPIAGFFGVRPRRQTLTGWNSSSRIASYIAWGRALLRGGS